MNAWKSLGEAVIQGLVVQWPIPFAEFGGKLWLRLPAVEQPEEVLLGVADNSFRPPTRLYFESIELQTQSQVIRYDIPPFIDDLFLGIIFKNEVVNLDVYYYLERTMTFYPPIAKPHLPVIAFSDFKKPSEVDYTSFILEGTTETFSRLNDDFWVGEERLYSDFFAPEKTDDPAALVASGDAPVVASWHPNTRDSQVNTYDIQNIGDAPATVYLQVEDSRGVQLDEQRTLAPNESAFISVNATAEAVGRTYVRAASTADAQLSLQVGAARLLTA